MSTENRVAVVTIGRRSIYRIILSLALLQAFIPAAKSEQRKLTDQASVGIIVAKSRIDAQEILRQLDAGMDFEVLAKETSIDPSARDGGYLGSLSSTELRPEIRDAVSGIKMGQHTGILQVSEGFAIAAVLSKVPVTEDLDEQRIRALTSEPTIRATIDISGFLEANEVLAHYPKPPGWDRDLAQVCASRDASITQALKALAQSTKNVDVDHVDKPTLDKIVRTHVVEAQLHAYRGEMDESIAEWKIAYQLSQSRVPEAVTYMQAALGISYLHLAEMENGSYRSSGEIDLIPPRHTGDHFAKQEESELAIQYFLRYLEQTPDAMDVKWLLNLAYMTLGEYPRQVPPQYLIPLNTFESQDNIGYFADIARAAKLNVFGEAGGVVIDDFDNDGYLDIVVSSMGSCDPLHLFHNNRDGTFTDVAAKAGLSGQLGGLNVIQADYNNDGCMDLLVLRGGWELPERKSLLRNNCDGTFTDVTDESGLGKTVTATQTAVWADIDNDGYLDLFIGNENAPNQLFRNRGDGTFEDISSKAGIDKTAFTKGVVAADYDHDGFVDFYVATRGGPHWLYHNNHDGTFTDVARQAGVEAPYFSFATWFFDYDNDGWPDLFVTSFVGSVDQVIRSYTGMPTSVETLKLYRNLHNGAFEDVTARVGLDKVFLTMGSNFGDVNNDGFLDIYLGNGNPSFAALMPHVLLENKAGKRFIDVTASSGTGELHKGHGIAFGDLARNGHEDIVSEVGGAIPSDAHALRVFKNPGNQNDWMNVRLVGSKSNREGVGAQIKITVPQPNGASRFIYRTVGETSSFGGNPAEQHVGLGRAPAFVSMDVWWPASNTRQHFDHIAKNQFISVTEMSKTYTKRDLPPIASWGRNEQ